MDFISPLAAGEFVLSALGLVGRHPWGGSGGAGGVGELIPRNGEEEAYWRGEVTTG